MRDDDQLCVKVGPTAAGRWEGLKIWRGNSNVGYIICPPVEIGLTDLPKTMIYFFFQVEPNLTLNSKILKIKSV